MIDKQTELYFLKHKQSSNMEKKVCGKICQKDLIVKCKISDPMLMPEYETEGAAGMDLKADLGGTVVLPPLGRALISTGVFLEIPKGYEGQVRSRSGLAAKQGLTVLNGIGTIDSDYRGELKVILINLSNEQQEILPYMRIAQIVFAKCEKAKLIPVTEFEPTKRGDGGFGSTGK